MSPVEVAKYLRAFQKAASTRKIRTRLIRRDGRFLDNVAELIRALLSKHTFRLVRTRRGYVLVFQGSGTDAIALRTALPNSRLRTLAEHVVRTGSGRIRVVPDEGLLDEVIASFPVLSRLRSGGGPPEPGEDTAPAPEAPDDAEVARPIAVTRVVPPPVVAAEFAAQVRAREQTPPIPTNVDFATDGARRFAERLARATRGRA